MSAFGQTRTSSTESTGLRLGRRLVETTRAAPRAFGVIVALGIALGGLTILQARFLSAAIDGAVASGLDLGRLRWPLLALVALAVLRAICVWASEWSAQSFAAHIKSALRSSLARHLGELGPVYSEGRRTGEQVHTLTSAVDALEPYLAQYLPQMVLALLVPLLLLLAVASTDPLSALVLIVTFPLVPLFMALIGAHARERAERQLALLARLAAQFLDGLQVLPVLKAFGRSREYTRRVARAAEHLRVASLAVLRVAFLSALVLELLASLSVAIVAVEVGLRLLYGRLDFGAALFVLILAPEFFKPLRALGASFHAGAAGHAAARSIFELLDTPLVPAATSPRLPAREAARIDLVDVRYAYPDGRRALDGVSLRIASGTTVALVGSTGAGKSTLAQLLLRFREPAAGTIQIDGVPLAEIEARAWRDQVSWVPQRPHLFFGSVLDNLRLARPAATREEIESAAQRAEAHDFIVALPQGYDTPLGESGARLSGGQAQRLALARAFLKDAPILILDEPTAQLDAATEARLQASLRTLFVGRTVLLIAHRLTTVVGAARIVVLSEGRVLEQGTHAELLARAGEYRRLVTAYGAAT